MLLRYIATVIAFSALFPLASALPTAGTDATASVSADPAVESLGPSLSDVVTNLVAEIAACTHELQSLGPNDLTAPGAEPFVERVIANFRRLENDASNVVESFCSAPGNLPDGVRELLFSLITANQNFLNELTGLESRVPQDAVSDLLRLIPTANLPYAIIWNLGACL